MSENIETKDNTIMKFDSDDYSFSFATDSQKMVWMKPKEFLNKAITLIDTENIENLKRKMLKNKPVDPLYLHLDVDNCQIIEHEGRHRAEAAQQLGIDRVPVIVWHINKNDDLVDIRTNKNCQCTVFNAKKQIK